MKIDWDKLKDAFTLSFENAEWYLDRKTGDVIFTGGTEPEFDDVTPEDLDKEPGRYISIDTPSSSEAYDWMVRFVEGLSDEKLAEKLARALQGKGPFRRFKDVLLDYPDQQEEWFRFEDSMINSSIEEWVEGSGLKPDDPPPWKRG